MALKQLWGQDFTKYDTDTFRHQILFSGIPLEPDYVNLYQFNHSAICPLTASKNLSLMGLSKQDYNEGEVLQQVDSDRKILGKPLGTH